MAVYTAVDPDDLAALVARYGIGTVVSCKGIAEGVENSNFLLETTGGRFILTLYEKRVSAGDLPFFVDLLGHLADKNCPVPAMIRDSDGQAIHQISGRAACIIQFLPGISLTHPTPGQCDRVIVIGAPNSSNSLRLVEVAERLGVPAHLVQRGTDVDPDWLTDIATLGITAGASAPETLVREVIDAVAAHRASVEDVVVTAEENMVFKLPRGLEPAAT